MYFCYLDESGTPQLSGSTSHFVLLGLAIPASLWPDKDYRINRIKAKYGLKDKEIHTGYIAREYSEQKRIPNFSTLVAQARIDGVNKERENILIRTAALRSPEKLRQVKRVLQKTADYIHLDHNERFRLLEELATELGKWSEVRLFAEAIDKREFGTGRIVYDQAFEQVVTRFNTFLSIMENERLKRGRHRSSEFLGLIIQDNNETMEKNLTQLMRRFHRVGTIWAKIPQIIETPLFVDSSLTSMVQMADLCAYAVRRYFENGEKNLLDRIWSRFDKKSGSVVGIRHFIGVKSCSCKVCSAHGTRYPKKNRVSI